MIADLQFNIIPYVGVEPIKFGAPVQFVHDLLGSPTRTRREDENYVSDYFGRMRVTYESGLVYEFGFAPSAPLLYFKGDNVWKESPEKLFTAADPDPVLDVGIHFFMKIGVTLSGFGAPKSPDRAITVFVRNRYPDLA